jgi:CubicO group peptidase (beta-lactamase class C family)
MRLSSRHPRPRRSPCLPVRAVAAGAATVLLAASALPAQQQVSPDWAAFDRYVAQAAKDWHVPGLAIAVVKGDSLVFAKGYGVETLGAAAPATEHTRFAIGSTTKAMTTAALAMLVDEGKVRWDDRVIDYLPDFQLQDAYATRELTIRDLLTHRTGLPGTDLLWVVPENQYTIAEMAHRLRYVTPVSSFRSTWAYQNVVYSIAGLLVEKISAVPWETFVRTRLFTPLGMTETVPLVSAIRGQPHVGTPHAEVNGVVEVVPMRSTDAVAPAGSVWSSVWDMSKWMRFMLDSGRVGTRRLIAPATFREIIAPQIRVPMEEYPALELAQPHFFSYALGWFVQDYGGETVWMHTGSIDGESAIIGLEPAQRVGVYVLANLDHAELRHALMYRAFDLYRAGPPRDWSAAVRTLFAERRGARPATVHATGTHASLPLDRYAGTYTDSAYGSIVVAAEGTGLHARYERADLGTLEQWEYDSFRAPPKRAGEGPTMLTFVTNGAGVVTAVQLYGNSFPRARPR